MLSKASVKKPYTVIVGLIIVLVLGFVSFSRMTMDLLPSINLPYVIVVTAYPGASPASVEDSVTKPVEQSLATVSNLQSIQSVSSENVSTVILEFAEQSNMDSVSLEMREKLDQVKSTLPDTVGNPIIIKMNPNMLPVYIAAVEKDGLNSYDLNKYVKNELSSSFERLEGVASVEISGGVDAYVSIILEEEKIDALNEKIKSAIEKKFAEGEDQIQDAEKELEDAQEELEEGREQFDEGKETAADQIGQASGQITDGQNELLSTEAELKSQIAVAQAKIPDLQAQRKQLVVEKQALETALEEINKISGRIDEVNAQLAETEELIGKIQAAIADSETLKRVSDLVAQIQELEERLPELSDEELQLLEDLREQLAEAAQALLDLGIPPADQETMKALLEEMLAQNEAVRDSLLELLEQLTEEMEKGKDLKEQLEATAAELNTAIGAIDSGIAQLNDAITQMNNALVQIQSGKGTLSEAVSQLNIQELNGIIEMAEAAANISIGDSQIKAAKEQLKQSKESLETQKELALEQADIRSKLSLDILAQVLTAQNFSMPAGYVTEDNVKYLVRVGDSAENLDELADIVLFDPGLEDIDPIKLKDVAEVIISDNSDQVYGKINGNDGIMLTMQKQTDYSTGDVTGRINDAIRELTEADRSLHITALLDQGEYIEIVVNSVLQNLLFGAILAIIVLFIFLKDIRPTLVVAVSIPMSVLVAIILMYFSGVTLNVISLSGLALGVGMLVDNSIVVIENIYRLRMLGMPIRKAAVQGARQMTGAIIASTLTTVCVFLPIVFTSGMARELFSDLALTIAFALLASLIIALTFIPVASNVLLKKPVKRKNKAFERLAAGYSKLLRIALKRKVLVIAVTVVLLVVSAYFIVQKGMIFFPDMESSQMTITMVMDDKTAGIEETGAMTDELVSRLETIEDITDIGAIIAMDSSLGLFLANNDENSANMYLILDEHKKHSVKEIEKTIYEITADMPCTLKVSSASMDMSTTGANGISLVLKGKDLDELVFLAEDVGNMLQEIDGIKNLNNGLKETTGELQITVNKEKAAKYDLTVAQVYQLVRGKITESQGTTTLSTDTEDYDIVIYDSSHNEYTRQDIRDMKISVTDKEGKTKEIPLSEIVTFKDGFGLNDINRNDQSRAITLTADIEEGANITLVANAVTEAMDNYGLPAGYSYEMTGEDQLIQSTLDDLVLMVVLGIFLMYLIMAAQFQSFKSPFIVMFTVPLAFTGGFLALLLTGMVLSIISIIGFILLLGVIVNNGIVLVDYINQLRMSGMEKTEAIVKAGSVRLRPIIMTALTTILGLATMAVGFGMGAKLAQPMAVVTIGGLLYGTFMTLFLVPCMYDIFNRKNIRVVTDEELQADEEDLLIMDETNYL